MNLEPLHELSPAQLRDLASALRAAAASSVSAQALAQILGPRAREVSTALDRLECLGMSVAHVAILVDALARQRENDDDITRSVQLVLSGPEVPGVPTADTGATMRRMFREATQELLLVGYAVHNAQSLFEEIAERMRTHAGLRVTMCLDIQPPYREIFDEAEVVRTFGWEFRQRHWPWEPLPELLHFRRSLTQSGEGRASLHTKCVVVDRAAVLVTSANFTEAAQKRNIEAGLLLRHPPTARKVAAYVAGLRQSGELRPCPF